jgi:hypothetical protein
MTDDVMLGSFETTMNNMQKLLNWSSAPLDLERYDQVYFNLRPNTLTAISNIGKAVIAYCDFQEPFVENISVNEGLHSVGMESLLRVPQFQQYLDFVGGESLEVTFFGQIEENDDGNQGRAKRVRIDGELTAEIYVPNSRSEYESMQLGIVSLYDDDNNWLRPSNNEPLETEFETWCKEFERIISIVDFDDFAMTNYPVSIQNGEFVLDVSDSNQRDSVSGPLNSISVDAPDNSEKYSRGFEELFSTISGEIKVRFEEDAPISVVRESNDDALCCRYVILPVADETS